ncbi:MAG: thiamine phosphate synthase [Acidobacteriota bacterium]
MRLDGPTICLVTDRRRLLGADASFEAVRRGLADMARDAVRAGVDLIQVREFGLETAQLVDLVQVIVEIAHAASTRVVVNDRLDVALACGADGVHLRADSPAPRLVRRIVPDRFLVGRSVHQLEEAREHAAAADYLVAGTVFPTSSKPSTAACLGAGGLEAIVRAVRVPVLAIGGIALDRVAAVAAAGAAGIAAIGLFLPGGPPIGETVESVRRQFDSVTAAF